VEVVGYVIMPNHIHCILNFPEKGFSLNKIISNAKRFMAYDILKRLMMNGEREILTQLKAGPTQSRKDKGQLHAAFRDSFDAKAITSERFLEQKLRYIWVPSYFKPAHFHDFAYKPVL